MEEITKKRVLLADDHQIILDGLRLILDDESDIDVVGTALDGQEVLSFLTENEVDVLVLDLSMPKLDGIETLKHLSQDYPSVKTVILSYARDGEKIHHVIQNGGMGYVLKNRSGVDLVNAIRAVSMGERFFPSEISETMYDYLAQGNPSTRAQPADLVKISVRETEVLACILDGMISKEIAEALCISKATVDSHKKNIMKKTGLHKDTQLALFARDRNIVPWSRREK